MDENNSVKITIIRPKKNIKTLENLCFKFSFGKSNKKHKLNVKIGIKRGLMSLLNNSFCISFIAGSLHLLAL